jgi:hypothetical protein
MSEFDQQGYLKTNITIPMHVIELIKTKNYPELDQWARDNLNAGELHSIFQKMLKYVNVEFILALRDANDPDEEDGIWHDDGSRLMAFSLSLNLEHEKIEGGELRVRKKGQVDYQALPTQPLGTLLIFKTGVDGFEHMVSKVTSHQRLVMAGWLS